MFIQPFKPLLAALLCASIFASVPALSDPPDHAKAHGWRKKNDPRYVGYTGREWERDYGVREGSCNRKAIGTVVGAAVGGAIGSQIGDGAGRAVAIIVGSVLGGVIGRELGEELDEGDRGCIGHALELAEPGQAVRWSNERTHVSYLLTPLALSSKDSKNCRRFKLQASGGQKSKTSEGRACRDGDGVWQMS
ncbi:MAG: RT0821/Lpp0805 family surface protein [Pseudomonadota bacterium]|nr:RT0821/Lpp0805 family surface protein [Pseudomonadota bacterium]